MGGVMQTEPGALCRSHFGTGGPSIYVPGDELNR